MVVLLIIGSLLLGFCEETLTRGFLIVGFRARFTEPVVWLLSTALFGLMHLPNWFFGFAPPRSGRCSWPSGPAASSTSPGGSPGS